MHEWKHQVGRLQKSREASAIGLMLFHDILSFGVSKANLIHSQVSLNSHKDNRSDTEEDKEWL